MSENNSEYLVVSNDSDSSVIGIVWCTTTLFLEEILQYFKDQSLGTFFGQDFGSNLGGSVLQVQVLRVFIGILFVNLILIAVVWRIYSHRISQALSSNRYVLIEELLKKNSPLKLPREHSPRF